MVFPRRASKRSPRRRGKARLLGLAFSLLCASGCGETTGLGAVSFATDAAVYEEGEAVQAVLLNEGLEEIFVPGCPSLALDRLEAGEWVEGAPSLVCVWEGFATAVPADDSVQYDFVPEDAGLWRARLMAAEECDPAKPLHESDCTRVGELTSNEFEVFPAQVASGGCVVTGCSAQLCSDQPAVTTCEFLPEYACYASAECGRFGPEGSCAWEPTAELQACVEGAQ